MRQQQGQGVRNSFNDLSEFYASSLSTNALGLTQRFVKYPILSVHLSFLFLSFLCLNLYHLFSSFLILLFVLYYTLPI